MMNFIMPDIIIGFVHYLNPSKQHMFISIWTGLGKSTSIMAWAAPLSPLQGLLPSVTHYSYSENTMINGYASYFV